MPTAKLFRCPEAAAPQRLPDVCCGPVVEPPGKSADFFGSGGSLMSTNAKSYVNMGPCAERYPFGLSYKTFAFEPATAGKKKYQPIKKRQVMLYIGIDLGTSAVRLLLMEGGGSIKNMASREYPLEFPQPGWSRQAPEDWRRDPGHGSHGAVSCRESSLRCARLRSVCRGTGPGAYFPL